MTQTLEPQTRKWTIDEYYQMADLGFFNEQHVELIDGEIVEMPPQRDEHAIGIELTRRTLEAVFGRAYWVRVQLPLRLAPTSEPEPDIAVVKGQPRDFKGKGHPSSAGLIVEISETTLRYDRRRKASLYASLGIEDYWIVNLVDRVAEVYRTRIPDPAEPFGWRFDAPRILHAGDSISPLAMPDATVRVDDLLP